MEIYLSDKVVIDKHVRIKILNSNGFKYANIKIPYHSEFDKISSIKAQTINFDENNEPVITEIEKSNLYENTLNEGFSEISFTFPDLKEGSIIEYKYTLNTTNIVFLNAWIFQDKIPTLYSKFSAVFPANLIYTYNVFYQGEKLLKKYGSVTASEWELFNLNGLEDEDFVYSMLDDAEILKFQLSEYYTKSATGNMDGSYTTKKFVPSWDKMSETVINNSGYVNYLMFTSKHEETLKTLVTDSLSNTDKIKNIYNYITSNYVWDGIYAKYTNQNQNQLLESKSGNSAEINLLLLSMLK